ncbi:MAG: amidase [Paracoccaceae bacterium]
MPEYPSAEMLRDVQDRFRVFAHLDDQFVQVERDRVCESGALEGRTVGLKANIAVKGARWSAGLAHRADLKAQADAALTGRLRACGARLLPGLNMDAAALGGASDNPTFGRTKNPRADAYSAGGSSGGSAAAVASGLVDLAIGTDTLGSIRIPASYCGVFGLKPTFGLVGRTGIVPLAPSLDTAGPLAAKAADLWPVLTALAGPDDADPGSRLPPEGWAMRTPVAEARSVRIGLPKQVDAVACDPEVLAALAHVQSVLAEAGAQIEIIDMPDWVPEKLRRNAFLLTEAEGAAVFAQELDAGGVLPEPVARLLAYGRGLSAAKLDAVQAELSAARAQLERSFQQVDLLLMPTTPQRAFHAGSAAPANQADFTALANVGGVPALAVPVRVQGAARPSSVQLVGPNWSEPVLIGLAMLLERAL